MRSGHLIGLCLAAGALVACHPKPLSQALQPGSDGRPMQTVARLTCPAQVDQLSRASQTPDGQSCTYSGPAQEQVDLKLVPLGGMTAASQLAALDTQLRADLPGAGASTPDTGIYVSGGANGDQAHIDLPGFHLNANGGQASIRMPGVAINANGDNAQVHTGAGLGGGAVINAHKGGAEVRTGGAGPDGVAATYLLAADAPGPSGDRATGYVAKGPAAGPLVVAIFHARGGPHSDNGGLRGLDRLVDLNVHGG